MAEGGASLTPVLTVVSVTLKVAPAYPTNAPGGSERAETARSGSTRIGLFERRQLFVSLLSLTTFVTSAQAAT